MPRPTAAPTISAQAQQDQVSEGIENFELPRSLVTKLAKSALPEDIKLQKDVILALQKSSTVFINYLAATAHDVALSKQHKSISASDVLKALEVIAFGDTVDWLTIELQTYREHAKSDKAKKPAVSKPRAAPGGASASSVSAPAPNQGGGPLSISITLPSAKGKGKAKAKDTISAPLKAAPKVQSIVDDGMDVDQDESAAPSRPEPEWDPQSDEVMDDNGDDEDEEDEEELVDTMAMEQEELRKDAQGLDDGSRKNDND